jgi:hypothetical protein
MTTKDVQYPPFRVEQDLKDSFNLAAKQANRPASQILREFMRVYVEHSQSKERAVPDDRISAAERESRQNAINFARANVNLEGFKVSDESEALARRFIKGEIELSDAMKAVHAKIFER